MPTVACGHEQLLRTGSCQGWREIKTNDSPQAKPKSNDAASWFTVIVVGEPCAILTRLNHLLMITEYEYYLNTVMFHLACFAAHLKELVGKGHEYLFCFQRTAFKENCTKYNKCIVSV